MIKYINGFGKRYRVTETGQVISSYKEVCIANGGLRIQKERILKGKIARGYRMVALYKDNVKHELLVHRLVAEAFIPNPDNKPEVNHIDGNKLNNRISNLEWATRSENAKHAYDTGLIQHGKPMLGRKGKSSPRSIPVLQIALDGIVVNQWANALEVERTLGFHNTNIRSAALGKIKTAYGFIWQNATKIQ